MEERQTGTPTLDREETEKESAPRPSPPPIRRLYRSRRERMLCGVCGGLGEYFNVDPVLIRLAFLILAFGGAGIFAYLVLWIVVPNRPLGEAEPSITTALDSSSSRSLLAWAFVAIGLLLLVSNLHLVTIGNWDVFWPALLIVAGAALLLSRSGGAGDAGER
jgi:phage shock protein C